ncbi:acetyl-CoA carboxylase carboxyltransferase subunit alpha [Flammeovirga yaeyamensis]|uniref:Acetyl-coenzyme A carboxylase carboxyl transferase subunit alpha n=1 Tax=Flammeovirga yaeyamensis TaxID=367791 RepID=A0AAX1N4Z3_9BACT|nr:MULTISPECIES: acetyl-CoA carboxylase carboxyltransferase subunit alpha [Flammeovirga]ANQ49980.1 acetyl-CoA carboxylase carboxyltransferase subunit alpha [Flammeovirga sp. MY04]MBB3700509.1 acetyl-CoA carboxylase carboxyl transferase subunit alpha [Flammeovirga yaeyamensis]NMF36870.1 acetyl-CoA carboxylase carboxyltransferase subunit alpha [Flammeovirga yaeyamensis]QWG02581.1 acetyl-CoA carboxylase carboxyltransferase subunit alpha [Flammeovirga yaeyamensis]
MDQSTLLDFEKPIAELEAKLEDMRELASQNNVDVSAAINELESKITQLKKSTFENLTRWQRVQLSRHADRPYTLDYIYQITDEFVELHGDRAFGDDKAMVGGLGTINGKTFMMIGQQKGRNTKQRQLRNFGMANPEGYRKALRLMQLAEKFRKPVVTFIDTPGAFPGIEAEERGQAEAIAKNLKEMFKLTVPVICIVIGEGASGGALGIAIGDSVMMLENTWYSVISPESCSSILWRSWDYKEQAAEALKLTAKDMKSFGLIDKIIPEPLGGAHTNPQEMFEIMKKTILEEVEELEKLDTITLKNNRIEKFSQMGVFNE